MTVNKKIKKTYSNDEIIVLWQPHMCTHSKKCWKELIGVFDPRKKPWVQLDGGSNKEIIAQINQCPSKALSYKLNNL